MPPRPVRRASSALLATLALAVPSLAAAQDDAPAARFTTNELWDRTTKTFDAFAAQYYGKTLEVTGPLWAAHVRAPGGGSDLQLSINGVAKAIECAVSDADRDALAALTGTKAPITVRGPWTVNYRSVVLKPCTFAVGAMPAEKPAGPPDPPLGEYAVYQMANLSTFGFQYRFTLLDRGRYRVRDGAVAAYRYDPATKTLRFVGGELKGFVGLYYTKGPNADGPTIALDAEGSVPDPEHAARGRYQYGFFRPGGVR